MLFHPATTIPPKADPHSSDLLIIKTSDGHMQLGRATYFDGRIHDWIVFRDCRSRAPSYTGDAHSINCFCGVEVVEWAELPPLQQIVDRC